MGIRNLILVLEIFSSQMLMFLWCQLQKKKKPHKTLNRFSWIGWICVDLSGKEYKALRLLCQWIREKLKVKEVLKNILLPSN